LCGSRDIIVALEKVFQQVEGLGVVVNEENNFAIV
jgi:hypothetical protein